MTRSGKQQLEAPSRLCPVDSRHLNVEKHDGRLDSLNQREGLLRGGGLSQPGEVARLLEDRLGGNARQAPVVDNDHADGLV